MPARACRYLAARMCPMAGGSSACIVVGHSSGGNAALRLAERQPVRGLILLGAGHHKEDHEQDR